MKTVIAFKPVRVEGRTKDEVLNKIFGRSIWTSSKQWVRTGWTGPYYQRGLRAGDPLTYRLYNLQKLRRKTEQVTRTITRGKRKGETETTINVIRRGHWVGYYYDVPAQMVEKVQQNNRNFTVDFKKYFS